MRQPRIALGRALGPLVSKRDGVTKKVRYRDKQRRLFQRGRNITKRLRRRSKVEDRVARLRELELSSKRSASVPISSLRKALKWAAINTTRGFMAPQTYRRYTGIYFFPESLVPRMSSITYNVERWCMHISCNDSKEKLL